MPMERILMHSNVFLTWPMAACASNAELGDFRIPLFLLAVEIRQRTDRVAADTMLIPRCLVLCPVVRAEE